MGNIISGIQGKVMLVTGSSRGIGKSVAYSLAEEGARVALCARNDHELKLTADEIQMHLKAEVVAVKANLTKLNDIRRFVNAAIKKFNRVDVLVNNAGSMHVGGIFQTSEDDWEYHIQLKLMGYIRLMREVIPHMKKNGGGKIINILGTDGRAPQPHRMVSGVINAALINFTKYMAAELEPDRITVNGINPGFTDTPLGEKTIQSLADIYKNSPDEALKSLAGKQCLGRLSSPGDIASTVIFLASDAAASINGISIDVDMGRTVGPG